MGRRAGVAGKGTAMAQLRSRVLKRCPPCARPRRRPRPLRRHAQTRTFLHTGRRCRLTKRSHGRCQAGSGRPALPGRGVAAGGRGARPPQNCTFRRKTAHPRPRPLTERTHRRRRPPSASCGHWGSTGHREPAGARVPQKLARTHIRAHFPRGARRKTNPPGRRRSYSGHTRPAVRHTRRARLSQDFISTPAHFG